MLAEVIIANLNRTLVLLIADRKKRLEKKLEIKSYNRLTVFHDANIMSRSAGMPVQKVGKQEWKWSLQFLSGNFVLVSLLLMVWSTSIRTFPKHRLMKDQSHSCYHCDLHFLQSHHSLQSKNVWISINFFLFPKS